MSLEFLLVCLSVHSMLHMLHIFTHYYMFYMYTHIQSYQLTYKYKIIHTYMYKITTYFTAIVLNVKVSIEYYKSLNLKVNKIEQSRGCYSVFQMSVIFRQLLFCCSLGPFISNLHS